jgi:hypothetical protein
MVHLARVPGHLKACKQVRVARQAACIGFTDAICFIRGLKGRPLFYELTPDSHLAFYATLKILSGALVWFQI